MRANYVGLAQWHRSVTRCDKWMSDPVALGYYKLKQKVQF